MSEKPASILPTYKTHTSTAAPYSHQGARYTALAVDNGATKANPEEDWSTLQWVLAIAGGFLSGLAAIVVPVTAICAPFAALRWLIHWIPFPSSSAEEVEEAAKVAVEEFKQSMLAAQLKGAEGVWKLHDEIQKLREAMEVVKAA